jgi:mRNA interferase RelE/StbE
LAFNIVYKKSVRRDLKKIPEEECSRVLDKIEADLSENADAFTVLKGKFAGLRKYRVGRYRVIFAILDNDVLILRIGHRKEVYKKNI